MNNKGQDGEQAAVKYLLAKGYKLLKKNYSCRLGEIDIIFMHGKYIIFTEVKTRKSGSMISGLESIDNRKIRKLTLAASKYLSENRTELQPRFDVVIVEKSDTKLTVTAHIENAF